MWHLRQLRFAFIMSYVSLRLYFSIIVLGIWSFCWRVTGIRVVTSRALIVCLELRNFTGLA
jgi:uncharacterized membrane protein (DUF485 family)